MGKSTRWKVWRGIIDLRTCLVCRLYIGKVYEIEEFLFLEPPVHVNCRCRIEKMATIHAGRATNDGLDGADYWLKNYGKLPDYYVTDEEARKNGWKPILGNLHQVLPGTMITKGVFRNSGGKLPDAPGRTWYEADINYDGFWRGPDRIVYSNDGLIFVTYDHYQNYIEVI